MTLQWQKEFEWETIPHTSYSPDIAIKLSFFHSLQNHLDRKNMISIDEVKTVLNEYFLSQGNFRTRALKVYQKDGRTL